MIPLGRLREFDLASSMCKVAPVLGSKVTPWIETIAEIEINRQAENKNR